MSFGLIICTVKYEQKKFSKFLSPFTNEERPNLKMDLFQIFLVPEELVFPVFVGVSRQTGRRQWLKVGTVAGVDIGEAGADSVVFEMVGTADVVSQEGLHS